SARAATATTSSPDFRSSGPSASGSSERPRDSLRQVVPRRRCRGVRATPSPDRVATDRAVDSQGASTIGCSGPQNEPAALLRKRLNRRLCDRDDEEREMIDAVEFAIVAEQEGYTPAQIADLWAKGDAARALEGAETREAALTALRSAIRTPM